MFYRDEKTGALVFLGGYGIGDDRTQDFVPPRSTGLLAEALDQAGCCGCARFPRSTYGSFPGWAKRAQAAGPGAHPGQ